MEREELEQKICDLEDLYTLETGLHVYDKGEYTEWLEEKYLSLTPAVKESEKPMTAEEFLAKRNYDPTLAYPHILVVQLMEEYASKPTVAEREVGDER